MGTVLAAIATIAVITTTAVASNVTPPKPTGARAASLERTDARTSRQLVTVTAQIKALRKLTWRCEDSIGSQRSVAYRKEWQLPRSVRVRAAVARKWVGLAKGCQKARKARTIPYTGDYVVATALAERVWPGSRSWLLSCAASEGGHGGFVMNRQGSGAGGQLQFMRGTYYANNDAAYAELARRGFLIDRAASDSWYSPLGQAIVGAYMLSIGQRGQWAGSGC